MPLPSPLGTAWLADAASQDLVILTRDGNLYVNEHERLAREHYRYRVFWIGPKKGTGQDRAVRRQGPTRWAPARVHMNPTP